MAIEIPDRLKDFAFTMVKEKSKTPITSDWPKKPLTATEIQPWIASGGNYGIITGYMNLVIIDADHDLTAVLVEKNLPPTFTVKTPLKGYHFYYFCKDFDKKIILKQDPETEKSYGDIRGYGFQTLGPGSIHPDTNTPYTILNNRAIASVTLQEIKEALADLIIVKYAGNYSRTALPITDVLAAYNISLKESSGELCGVNPVHGSTTGANFRVNVQKSAWHCFRCNSGGGPMQLIAVLEKIIQCSEATVGALQGDAYARAVDIAKNKFPEFYNNASTNIKKSNAVPNIDSAVNFIEKNYTGKIWYDEFADIIYCQAEDEKPRQWQDYDTLALTRTIQRKVMPRISSRIVHEAVTYYGHLRAKNPLKDWVTAQEWDGTERIEDFFHNCFNAANAEYIRSASRNFWIGIAARIMRPGCQLDNMVILEGHQGTFKTSALRAIGGQWHKEINTSVKGTDFFVALQGVLIAEICEMDSFNHAEVTRIKSIITCTVDHYRPPYGRCVIDRPRRCVFVGTTNSDNYLRDETGGRRFWPIKCGIINLERIESMREQLYAEAVHRYKAGEAWYVMPGDITKEMQDSRRHQDLWEEIVREFIDEKPRNQITLQEIAEQCLDIKTEKWDLRTAHRLGTIMRALGWESRVIREGHSTRRVWVNTNTSADRPF